jgi:mannose-6-phosphate isomerase-like protein (cupin superfamily)
MIRKPDEFRKLTRESVRGGSGTVYQRYALHKDETEGKGPFRMVAFLSLEPGTVIGTHPHETDAEMFLVLAGKGIYIEDGNEYSVGPGDFMMAGRGQTHGLRNPGEEPLEIIAVIAE